MKIVKKAEQESTEEFIERLSEDLKPVKHIFSPVWTVTPWLIVVLGYLAGVVHFLGLRMDWEEKLAAPEFLFELSLTFSIAVSAGYCAGWMAVPDMREKNWMQAVPLTLFGAFLLYMLCHIVPEGMSVPHLQWHHCFSDAILMAFVPIAALSILVKQGATTRPRMLSLMSVLAVGALGWGALRLTCMQDDVAHTLFYHFIPFIIFAVLVGVLARRLYRW